MLVNRDDSPDSTPDLGVLEREIRVQVQGIYVQPHGNSLSNDNPKFGPGVGRPLRI